MRVLGDLMHHVRLATRMARSARVAPDLLYRRGDLDQKEWSELVQKCRRCDWARQCPDWLDSHADATDAPKTCPNRRTFQALRRRASARQTEEA